MDVASLFSESLAKPEGELTTGFALDQPRFALKNLVKRLQKQLLVPKIMFRGNMYKRSQK